MKAEGRLPADMQPKNRIHRHSIWSFLLLLAISLARIGGGMFISIHGPTLLTLARNVGVSVSDVSWLFGSRSIGLLAGGVATGFVMKRLNNMYTFAGASFVLAAVVTATPWITHLWLLILVVMVGGVVFGYLDAGMQALILQVWGEKESRGLISGYHFMIAFGAFLAPLIAQPFLGSGESEVCPNQNRSANFTDQFDLQGNSTTAVTRPSLVSNDQSQMRSENQIVWAYLICGGFLIAVGLLFVALGILKTETRLRLRQRQIVEKRAEDSLGRVGSLLSLVCAYFFFCVAGETAYNSYIYSVSICSRLQFDVQSGTMINSLFWVGFGSGRLLGVLVLRYVRPKHVILVDLASTVVAMAIVCVTGERYAAVTWAVTFLYSFLQATVYPVGVSWTSQYTNVSGFYVFVFSTGQAFGSMLLLPLGGFVFDLEPFSIMYLILACTSLNAVVFLLMIVQGKRVLLARNETSLLEDKRPASGLVPLRINDDSDCM